jgi:hypothetical protein
MTLNKPVAMYGNRRVPHMMKRVQEHRDLVRMSGDAALEASWEKIEEFVDFFYGEVGKKDNLGRKESVVLKGVTLGALLFSLLLTAVWLTGIDLWTALRG